MHENIYINEILIIIGNDKISNKLVKELHLTDNKIKILRDKSLNLKKLIRVISKI